jgi:integrase
MAGQLFFVRKSWSLRYWLVQDGRRVRRCVSLGTDDREKAQTRAARLLRGADPATAQAPETFAQAARRILAGQDLATKDERLSRLERWAFPAFGAAPVTAVKPAHIRQALGAALAEGRSRSTITHLKDDVSTVLSQLWRDEVVSENWADRVQVPAGARTDRRPRVVLTDGEFERFQASPVVPDALKLLALVSRTLGGARTGELHVLDWRDIDTEGWLTATVRRPKTRTVTRLAIPDVLLKSLFVWWRAQGQPRSGPVFPAADGRPHGKRSWARELRRYLWMAEVRRAATRAECALQTNTPETLRADFHSFRRAYNTGLARAGLNVQQAMALAGHRNPATHMRYVGLVEALEAPAEALPRVSGVGQTHLPPDSDPSGC